MEGLGQAGPPATVYLRGAPPEALRRLERPGIRFLDAPRSYGDILPRCSLTVNYGGLRRLFDHLPPIYVSSTSTIRASPPSLPPVAAASWRTVRGGT